MNSRYGWMAVHSAAAAAFFFTLQYWGLKQSLESSLIWAAVGGAGAAWVSWQQTGR